jgi:UBX domain-containing protein 1
MQEALDDFYNGGTQNEELSRELPIEQSTNSQPTTVSSSSRPASKKPNSNFRSFQQLINEDSDDEDQNLYAGGDRGSALNVENPDNANRLVRDLLKKAESDQGAAHEDDIPSKPKFSGVGYQLGDSSTPSRTVGSAAPKRLEKAHREITFWKDGFQVGDGQLYRYDDPANSHYLNELNAGRAPLSLLNVEFGQEVVVNVSKKLDEEYKPPKKKVAGFHGKGQRLGSPVSPDYIPPSTDIKEPTPDKEEEIKKEEEEPKGDAQVQIRLADGRRIVRRVDSSEPVQSLFDFVATQTDSERGWNLNYAFPVKPIEEREKTIKELGLVNAVVVQRWVQ